MSEGAWISQLQWTAVFAVHLLGGMADSVVRAGGAGLAALWIAAGLLPANPPQRRRVRVLRGLAIGLATLPFLLLGAAYLWAPRVADPVLVSQQQTRIIGLALLLTEGAALAAIVTLIARALRGRRLGAGGA